MTDARQLVRHAILHNDVVGLLLGRHPYAYRSKFSPANSPTDHAELFEFGVYRVFEESPGRKSFKRQFDDALRALVENYEALPIIAFIILIEIIRRKNGKISLEVDLDELGKALLKSIERHKTRLIADTTREGYSNPQGRYGDLVRLSRICERLGAPRFVPN